MSALLNSVETRATELEPKFAWPRLDELPSLQEEAPPAFPVDSLGPVLGPAAQAIADLVQAPDALAAGSVLASAALGAQCHADVQMPHGSRAPLSLNIVTGAGSGDRKTATDQHASWAAEEVRKQQARDHSRHLREYELERASRKKEDGPSVPPVARSLLTSNATTEGLAHLLRNQSHVGVFTGEGGELLGGHSMRDERRAAGLAFYLKAWGGETISTLTRGDGSTTLIGRRVSMHVLVQPVLLRQLLADPLAQGQGFLARCLIAQPSTLAGTRMFREPSDVSQLVALASLENYNRAMARMYAIPPATNPDGDGYELTPRLITMSDEAIALWIEFYNAIEREQAPGASLAGARPFASKAAEQAARIAGVIAMASNVDASVISAEAMEGAIAVVGFYLDEHVRLTGVGVQDLHLRQLQALQHWLAERRSVPHRDVLQVSPRHLRDLKADGLGRLLDELRDRGYIRRVGDRWEHRP